VAKFGARYEMYGHAFDASFPGVKNTSTTTDPTGAPRRSPSEATRQPCIEPLREAIRFLSAPAA
jgi:hypothetical protein